MSLPSSLLLFSSLTSDTLSEESGSATVEVWNDIRNHLPEDVVMCPVVCLVVSFWLDFCFCHFLTLCVGCCCCCSRISTGCASRPQKDFAILMMKWLPSTLVRILCFGVVVRVLCDMFRNFPCSARERAGQGRARPRGGGLLVRWPEASENLQGGCA